MIGATFGAVLFLFGGFDRSSIAVAIPMVDMAQCERAGPVMVDRAVARKIGFTVRQFESYSCVEMPK